MASEMTPEKGARRISSKIDHGYAAPLRRQKVKQGVIGVFALAGSDICQGPSLQVLMLRQAEGSGMDILKAHQSYNVLKVRAVLHPAAHTAAALRILEGGGERIHPSGLKFRRQYVDQLGGPGGIGVGITGDIQSFRPGGGDHLQHLRDGPPPVPPADGLQMADLHRCLQ